MGFVRKFSNEQKNGISLIILALIIYFVTENYIEDPENFILIISFFMILIGIGFIYNGTKIRFKILHSHNIENVMEIKHTKGELKVAEYFKKKKIKFLFQPKLKVEVPRFKKIPWLMDKSRILTPDFYLPEYDIYVEYCGMMDNQNYKKNNYDKKKKTYKKNMVEYINIYERNLGDNLDWIFTQKLMQIFKERTGNEQSWGFKKH